MPAQGALSAAILAACTYGGRVEHSAPAPNPTTAPKAGRILDAGRTTRPEPRRPPLPDGCYDDAADSDATAAELVARLASDCAPGTVPMLPEARVVSLRPHGSAIVGLNVARADRCFRVVASGPPGLEQLDVVVVDPTGAVIGSNDLWGRFAVVDRAGPICPSTAGLHHLRLTGGDADVQVVVQALMARAD